MLAQRLRSNPATPTAELEDNEITINVIPETQLLDFLVPESQDLPMNLMQPTRLKHIPPSQKLQYKHTFP